jgi:hypothetical protein
MAPPGQNLYDVTGARGQFLVRGLPFPERALVGVSVGSRVRAARMAQDGQRGIE